MAGYRQSAAEMEVQEYLAKAQAGLAGVNPKAQTLARSSGNPQAQAAGQELVARQLQENAARREAVAAERTRAWAEALAAEQRRQEKLRLVELQRQAEARVQAERPPAAEAKVAPDPRKKKPEPRDFLDRGIARPVPVSGDLLRQLPAPVIKEVPPLRELLLRDSAPRPVAEPRQSQSGAAESRENYEISRSTAEEAEPAAIQEWKAKLIEAASLAPPPEPGAGLGRADTPEGQAQVARAKALAALGGLPAQIKEQVRKGEITLRTAEEVMQKLWRRTLQTRDPRDPEIPGKSPVASGNSPAEVAPPKKHWPQMSVKERADAQEVGGIAQWKRDEWDREIEEQQRVAEARRAEDTRDAGTRKRQQEEMGDFGKILFNPYPWVEKWHGQTSRSPEEAAPLLLDRYLEIRDGSAGQDRSQREQQRAELARSMGLQPGNDRAVVDRLREDFKGRWRQDGLMEKAASAAILNRVLLAAGFKDGVPDYEAWQAEASKRATYKRDTEANYYHAWRNTGKEMEKRLQPIAGKLEEAYQAMQGGDLALGRFYDEVDFKDRALFLTALRMVAERMPSKDGDTVWGQVVKSNERFWRDTGSSLKDFWDKPFDTGPPIKPLEGGYTIPLIGDRLTKWEQQSYEKQLKQYRADQLKRHEVAGRKAFRDDINRINDQGFDPIRALKTDGWWEGMLEQAAYGAPAVLGTVGMAALPGGWAPLAIKANADTHRELRHYLLDHQVEEGRANEIAGQFSLALTVPTLALDRLRAAGMMRKLPFFEAAMKNSVGRITNGALRFASEASLRGAAMAGSNMLQEPLPELAKDAMHALQKDLPGADWEHFFSGYWTRQASTMAVMLPLAAASGAVGRIGSRMEETQRVKYLMSRSDTELVALGVHLEHVKALRAAGDDVSLAGTALRDGLKNLDPMGPAAKAATRLLELDVEDKQLNARHGKVQEQWAAGPQWRQPEQQQYSPRKPNPGVSANGETPPGHAEIPAPDAAQSLDAYIRSLETRPTPERKPHDLYEREKTGPVNRLIRGGGVQFWADDVVGREIREAKFVKDAKKSPFVDESKVIDFIRGSIERKIDKEFAKMAAIIRDSSNPLESVTVIVNNPAANPYFLRMLEKHGLKGRVVNE